MFAYPIMRKIMRYNNNNKYNVKSTLNTTTSLKQMLRIPQCLTILTKNVKDVCTHAIVIQANFPSLRIFHR